MVTNRFSATEAGGAPHRAAVYVRTSTCEPAAVRRQSMRGRQHLEETGHSGDARLFSDQRAGLSVGPGLQRMLKACRDGAIDRVVVGDLTRLSRDAKELARIRQELRDCGVRLEVVEDSSKS